MEPQRTNDRTETFQAPRSESPRLKETSSPRIRRSASPSLRVKYDNMYSLSHASTSSSPHLQLPQTTVLRRTLSSLSFQSGLDDNADLGENNLEYGNESGNESGHYNNDHYPFYSEKDNREHIHLHEGHPHNANAKPLPTLSYIFISLSPSQKTLFTWGAVHLFLGILLWLKGQWGCGLSLTGFAYLVIFDALGVFTTFISSVIATCRILRESTIRNPFGFQRYEVLFGFINTLYLLFVALYMLKEGLEHFILETSEEHVEGHSQEFPMIWVLLALGATLISAICYRNHKIFSALLRSETLVIEYQSKFWQNRLSIVLTNLFTLSTLLCGVSVILVGVLTEQSHSLGWLDKLISILESLLMFYIAGPVATALSKILLQTTPDATLRYLEACLREIQLDPTILSLTATHFWSNSYGQLVGTICVQVNQDADEQAVLDYVYSRLSPMFVNNDGNGELTVQIVK